MASVTSRLLPPAQNPCLRCRKLNDFKRKYNALDYQSYRNLDITIINKLRSMCASCKGAVYAGYGSGSYKGDLVYWWTSGTKNHYTPGTGRTSRFSQKDINRILKTIKETGMTRKDAANLLGISRDTLYKLLTGKTKNLKKTDK